ncbi:hypothetical protein [Spirosoma terrae]|uniref:Uncharacterized protein n=1 Tax=Spirosoma terrae TaxID=1968276 RepID=A0A6L9L2Y2_9BACT|nr:hypothetical protein [Spirosoma terrae]NDU94915.1 hypothetical protein [Spirosoma terrae]
MYLRQAKKLLAVSVLWLAVGVSCKRDEPYACPDGNCCWPGLDFEFVKRVEGGLAGISGDGFLFKEIISDEPPGWGPFRAAMMCPVQASEISSNYKPNLIYVIDGAKSRLADSTNMYSYRVWGTIYEMVNVDKLAPGPIYTFRLDRAQKVN